MRTRSVLFLLAILASCICLYVYLPLAIASSEGVNTPSTVANDASFGVTAWTNPGNATVSDDSYATNASTIFTQYLKATDYGFSIPTDATIDGIEMHVELHADFNVGGVSGRRWDEKSVRLVVGGIVVGTDYATLVTFPITTSDTTITYGTPTELWGLTISPSDINASNFGAVFAAEENRGDGDNTLYVDSIGLTVYYTTAGGSASINNYFIVTFQQSLS